MHCMQVAALKIIIIKDAAASSAVWQCCGSSPCACGAGAASPRDFIAAGGGARWGVRVIHFHNLF
jgi:hypothetical protein